MTEAVQTVTIEGHVAPTGTLQGRITVVVSKKKI